MSFKQTNNPVYEVSCDCCHLTKVVDDKSEAYGSGFREITITVAGLNESDPDAFASVVVWMCDKCKSGFDQAIKPYLTSLFAPK